MKYSIFLFLLSGCGLTVNLDRLTINEVYLWSQNVCPRVCEALQVSWTGNVTVYEEGINCVCEPMDFYLAIQD